MINHLNSSLKLKCNTSSDNMKTTIQNSNDTVGISIDNHKKMDDEIESAIETLEIISNPESLKGIEEGLQDINERRTSTFDEFLSKHSYDAGILELRSDESARPLTKYLAKKDMQDN